MESKVNELETKLWLGTSKNLHNYHRRVSRDYNDKRHDTTWNKRAMDIDGTKKHKNQGYKPWIGFFKVIITDECAWIERTHPGGPGREASGKFSWIKSSSTVVGVVATTWDVAWSVTAAGNSTSTTWKSKWGIAFWCNNHDWDCLQCSGQIGWGISE